MLRLPYAVLSSLLLPICQYGFKDRVCYRVFHLPEEVRQLMLLR